MLDELRTIILGQTLGNFISCVILILLYYNFLLFEDYWKLIVWVFLISQALRGAKEKIIFVLDYLSHHDTDTPLLEVIYHNAKIYLFHPYQGRTSLKLLILNNGIFIFALLGAVSVFIRIFSWIRVLYASVLAVVIMAVFLRVIDRKIFYYRYFISDQVLVSSVLIIGLFSTGIFVVLFLGTESFIEGSKAASDISTWVQEKVINDEFTRKVWTEQIEHARTVVNGAIVKAEATYNETLWWPIVKSFVTSYANYELGNEDLSMTSSANQSIVHYNFTSIPQAFFAMKDKMISFNITSTQLSDWTSTGFEFSSIAVGSVVKLVIYILTIFLALFGLGIRAVFFVTALFYQLSAKEDPLERFVNDMLPISAEMRPPVLRSARLAIEGVFFLPVKISSLHSIITLVSFNIMDVEFQYLATLVTFFISVLPIIPAYLVCFPWAVTMCMTQSIFMGTLLFSMNYVAFSFIDDALYIKSLSTINSYVTALSIVFGYYVFGFEGVVFGPLLVCAGNLAYEVSGQSIKASTPELETGDNQTNKMKLKDKDISPLSSQSVRMILVLETFNSRKVRFIAPLAWSYPKFLEKLRQHLKLPFVTGISTVDGVEILSVDHIEQDEKILVRTCKQPFLLSRHDIRVRKHRHIRRNRSESPAFLNKNTTHCSSSDEGSIQQSSSTRQQNGQSKKNEHITHCGSISS